MKRLNRCASRAQVCDDLGLIAVNLGAVAAGHFGGSGSGIQ
jgi:hypothetical protein